MRIFMDNLRRLLLLVGMDEFSPKSRNLGLHLLDLRFVKLNSSQMFNFTEAFARPELKKRRFDPSLLFSFVHEGKNVALQKSQNDVDVRVR